MKGFDPLQMLTSVDHYLFLVHGGASCNTFTFPADTEVLHNTLPILIQHPAQLFH